MSTQVYYFLHVTSLMLLLGFTFKAFAAPQPEHKSKTMMLTGIFSLIAFIAGFGLISKLGHSFTAGWVIVKLVAWLGIAALSGMAYGKPEKAGTYSLIAILLVAAAVYAVYYKPF